MAAEHRLSLKSFLIRIIHFFLQLPCGPEKVDTLLYAANEEIQNLIKNGPSKENLEKVKQQWIEKYKVDIKENGTWLSQLESFYFPGDRP